MIFRTKSILFCLILCVFNLSAKESKRPLTPESLADWQRITQSHISNDGRFVVVNHEPWKGDGTVLLFNSNGKEITSFSPAKNPRFSVSSRYLIVEQKPSEAEVEKLKKQKTKPEQMPLDNLILFSANGEQEVIDSIRTYKVAEESDWLAYQQGNGKDSTLFIRSLDGRTKYNVPAVSDFDFSEKGGNLYFITKGDSLTWKQGIYVYQTSSKTVTSIKEGEGNYKKAAFDKAGNLFAFLFAEKAEKDSTDKKSANSLYLSNSNETAQMISTEFLPSDWIINDNGKVSFSENGEYLFFPTSPEPCQEDTTILAENRPDVQIWNWNESIQYTQQHVDFKTDTKKTYTAVLHIPSSKKVQLNTPEFPDLQLPRFGDVALTGTSEPYGTERMWTGRRKADVYSIDLKTGKRMLLIEKNDSRIQISPAGKYCLWYNETDSSWFSHSFENQKTYQLTTPDTFQAWNSENDVPDHPSAYGSAGWSKDDQFVLIYDRYDIWRFSPEGTEIPVNLTTNGKKEGITYRIKLLDNEETFIDLKKPQFLLGFDEKTKSTGFYSASFDKRNQPKELLTGDFKATLLAKAKDTDAIIYTTETFSHYPDIIYSDLSCRKSIKLTSLGSQQEEIRWGTAELISWTSLDGKPLEGVVYKPENFDSSRKYPLIVNFYERNSDTFHSYRMPEPHRSTVDYHLYNSNEYIIFNPDIHYEDGYPGESCFNCVMPGIASLINQGFINEKAIAAQGHSWGGYQVAYLATRTNLFAAIESGAPVVNMYSAYGGIRWGTGLNRSFQYEHGQSRIGATPWESPLRYQENSPLFTMDKVTTPTLIMHNDADGHVPWYQGIEYFVALKRLQKPVWLLNYSGEPHWPMKIPNRLDFQKRMFQFFDHYLKGSPMPKWMEEGVKATDQPFELGY